jgi:adenosylhomocysteine nucleosidase
VGVVCALRSEARHLGHTLSRHPHLDALPDGLLLAVTGIGCAAAAAGAQRLVGSGAAGLVSFGLAGGLDPALPAGTIFLPSEIAAQDGALLSTDATWRARVRAALNGRAPIDAGRLVTTRHPVAVVAEKAALFQASGARAVDMESFGVAEVARSCGVPFIAVRVIVDAAEETLPQAVIAATDAAGHTSLLQLLGQLARRPRELRSLVRLAHGYHRANRSLAAVARTGALALFATAAELP